MSGLLGLGLLEATFDSIVIEIQSQQLFHSQVIKEVD